MAKKKASSSSMSLTQRLERALKKNLEGAKEKAVGGGFDEYDDGKYLARMVHAELGESNSSGRLQVDFQWKFISGEYKGKIKHDYQGVESEDNQSFCLRVFQKLGYETDEIEGASDITGILKQLNKEKPKAKISLKTKGEFQNVFIIKAADSDEDEEAESDDEDGDDAADDDEEDEPKKKKSSKKKKKADDDEDEEEEDSSDDDDSDDEDEEEEKPKKKKKSKSEDDEEEEEESEDEDEDEAPKKKKKGAKADDEDEEEEDEEDESGGEDVEVSVGSGITYKFKGKKAKGTVLEIFPKENKVRVQTGDAKRRISFDSIEDVEPPEEPKKKKKVKR